MTELTCAIVLVVCSLVTATPHGYGTKGGALAKAEASDVPDRFRDVGVVPIDIPNGAGYSGSFSKSSSSSFSSASASSSSSSSSFSYNGVGAAGFPGGAGPSAGCGSGGCLFDGNKRFHGSSGAGAGIQSYSGANAVASAGAGALAGCGASGCQFGGANRVSGPHGTIGADTGSQANNNANSDGAECGSKGCTGGTGTSLQANSNANAAASAGAESEKSKNVGLNQPSGCAGSNCNNPSGTENKCTSGQCGSNSATNDKCASGQCGTASQTGVPSIDHGPNDILVTGTSVSRSKSNYDSKDQSNADHDKTSSASIGHESGCSYGKCEPAGSSYSKLLFPYTSSNTHETSSPSSQNYQPAKCDSPNCNTYDYNSSPVSGNVITPAYNKPALHLTTPKQGSGCSTPNCQSESVGTQPSSFVPLNTLSSQSGGKSPLCSSGNCGNSQTLPTSYLSPPYGPTNCEGRKCVGSPSDDIGNTGSPGSKYPGCAPGTPNCVGPSIPGSSLPSYNAPSAGFPSSQSDTGSHAPGSGLPSYNAASTGFPTGHINTGTHALGSGLPSYNAASTGFPTGHFNAGSHAFGSGVPSYNAPSTGFPSSPSNAGSRAPGTGLPSYNPPSTGFPTSQPNAGSHAVGSGVPSYTTPSAGFPLSQSGIGPHVPGSFNVSPTGLASGSHIPGSGLPSYNVSPTGFATGSHTPVSDLSSYNTPSTGFPSGQSGAGPHKPEQNSYNTPSTGTVASCKTPNCADKTFHTNSQPGTIDITKPISFDQKLPPYTGGFGGPSGILKPNEYSVTASDYHNKPTTPSGAYNTFNYSPISCSFGNCGSKPGHTSPAYAPVGTTSGAHATAGAESSPSAQSGVGPSASGVGTSVTPSAGGTLSACKTPNCAHQTSGTSAQSGSYGVVKPSDGSSSSSQKLPAYTGGFGGPAGLLKPNEYSVPVSNYHHKPTTPSGIINPTFCSTGSCGSQPGHTSPSYALGSTWAQATASAAANADAVAYTGGFGGPPGLLKPYDSGKHGTSGATGPTGKQLLNPEFGSHQGAAGGATSLYGSKVDGTGSHVGVGAQASAIAQASAASGASSGAYGGSAHGENNGNGLKATGGCGGGCGSGGSSNGGSNFGASGGLGHSKLGILDGFDSGLIASGATAKSQASAVSGAGAFGLGGSYTSSSATAHASSGAAVKGGYGRR